MQHTGSIWDEGEPSIYTPRNDRAANIHFRARDVRSVRGCCRTGPKQLALFLFAPKERTLSLTQDEKKSSTIFFKFDSALLHPSRKYRASPKQLALFTPEGCTLSLAQGEPPPFFFSVRAPSLPPYRYVMKNEQRSWYRIDQATPLSLEAPLTFYSAVLEKKQKTCRGPARCQTKKNASNRSVFYSEHTLKVVEDMQVGVQAAHVYYAMVSLGGGGGGGPPPDTREVGGTRYAREKHFLAAHTSTAKNEKRRQRNRSKHIHTYII